MEKPKFYIRSDQEYHEFSLSFCGKLISTFKKSYFRKNSKFEARIYTKVFFPNDCPERLWMYYLVFEVNGKNHQITPITVEAFDTLTRGIEPERYNFIEFYTIERWVK